MTDEIVFYTHPMSRGRIVRWMLEEVGYPDRTELLDFDTTMKAPAYLAINPMGKVPAIRHGAAVITEVAAICAYLADAFPQGTEHERMVGYGSPGHVPDTLEGAPKQADDIAGSGFGAADVHVGS